MTFTQKTSIYYTFFIIFWLIIGYSSADYINTYRYSDSTVLQSNSDNVFITDKVKKTINIIKNNFYWFNQKTATDIEDAVMKSVVNGLWDKHSTYFTKQESTEFEEALRGDFEWIGAVINDHPKGIKIMKIIVGSPAEKSGLKAGDIMVRVGDVSLVWKKTEDAIKVIRGPKWTEAKIVYKRWDENTELSVSVIRDKVNVPSVAEKMLENKIGYIEIATFGEHTASEFVKSWNTLSSSGALWMILDFRNNGGGYLETAIDMASIVLQSNSSVVIIKQNDPKKNEILLTRSRAKSNINMPIIILINEYSASASEIFAGAIKDHNRGILLGEKSYWKWSVQEPFDLGDGSIVKITTARWYTPNDVSIDEKWITPDVQVILTNKDYESIFDRQLKAAEVILQDQIISKSTVETLRTKYSENSFTTITKE